MDENFNLSMLKFGKLHIILRDLVKQYLKCLISTCQKLKNHTLFREIFLNNIRNVLLKIEKLHIILKDLVKLNFPRINHVQAKYWLYTFIMYIIKLNGLTFAYFCEASLFTVCEQFSLEAICFAEVNCSNRFLRYACFSFSCRAVSCSCRRNFSIVAFCLAWLASS